MGFGCDTGADAGPNGEDIIVDDSKSSYENTVTMVLFAGR